MKTNFVDFAREHGYINTCSSLVNEEGKEFGYNGLSLLSHEIGAWAETIPCVNSNLAGFVGFEKAFQKLAVSDGFSRVY